MVPGRRPDSGRRLLVERLRMVVGGSHRTLPLRSAKDGLRRPAVVSVDLRIPAGCSGTPLASAVRPPEAKTAYPRADHRPRPSSGDRHPTFSPGDHHVHHRHRHRPAAEGARVDLHRGVVPAHVRAPVVLADPDRGDRRVRGGMVVLRWRIQGPDPGQSETRCHRCGPGEPPVVDRLVGLRATRRFRDRSGESPLPAGQTESRAGRPIRPRQLLRRRILRQHRLRAGRRHRVVHRYGGNADPRHDQRPPAGGVQRPGTCCAAPSPTCL